MNLFQKLKETDDPIKRRVLFVALLSREVEKLCAEMATRGRHVDSVTVMAEIT